MYAIFEDGSRQYRVEEGTTLNIDYRECAEGDTLELSKVLLIENGGDAKFGTPHLNGAKVVAQVVGFPKVKTQAQLFRRRKNSRKLRGHSQPHVKVLIKQIVG